MSKNAKIKQYSKDMMEIVNDFDSLKKSKNRVIHRMALLAKALEYNGELMKYVLNTTCGEEDFHGLTKTLADFEAVSETVNFHITRLTREVLEPDGIRSSPCVISVVTEALKQMSDGKPFVKKDFTLQLRSCERTTAPRERV